MRPMNKPFLAKNSLLSIPTNEKPYFTHRLPPRRTRRGIRRPWATSPTSMYGNQGRLFELVHILLCHNSGTGIDESRYGFASNHLHKRADAEFPDFLWELRD